MKDIHLSGFDGKPWRKRTTQKIWT